MPAGPIQLLNCYREKIQDDIVPAEHSLESQRGQEREKAE